MKLSISIMAHPKRAEYIPYLKSKLGDVPVALDDGCGLLENCKRAWRLRDPNADYHCVIQDDCIICDDFYNRAIERLEKAGGLAVSFFYSQSKFFNKFKKEADATGAITKKSLYGGLAICLPVHLIPEMLVFYDTQTIPFDDHRINRFLMSRAIDIYSPIPCLVDHRQNHMSLFTGKKSEAVACKFIDNI